MFGLVKVRVQNIYNRRACASQDWKDTVSYLEGVEYLNVMRHDKEPEKNEKKKEWCSITHERKGRAHKQTASNILIEIVDIEEKAYNLLKNVT